MFKKGFEKVSASYEWLNKRFVSGLNKRMSKIPADKKLDKQQELGGKVKEYLKSKFKNSNDMNAISNPAVGAKSIKPGSTAHKMLRDLNNVARKHLPK